MKFVRSAEELEKLKTPYNNIPNEYKEHFYPCYVGLQAIGDSQGSYIYIFSNLTYEETLKSRIKELTGKINEQLLVLEELTELLMNKKEVE